MFFYCGVEMARFFLMVVNVFLWLFGQNARDVFFVVVNRWLLCFLSSDGAKADSTPGASRAVPHHK